MILFHRVSYTMVATNISSIQVSNFADFRDKDGAIVSIAITELIDCLDAVAIYYGITGKISRFDSEQAKDFINIAAFSNREECMTYAKGLARKRNIPFNDITVI